MKPPSLGQKIIFENSGRHYLKVQMLKIHNQLEICFGQPLVKI